MALKKGDIAQATKSRKKKMEKVKKIEIDFDINNLDDNTIEMNMEVSDVIEPYVRNRLSGAFITNKEGKREMKGTGHLYDPLNTYKNYIRKEIDALLKTKYPNYQLGKGEVELDIIVYTKPPQSFTIRQKVWGIIKKVFRPLTKPDIDNVAKTVMDLFNKKFWEDDNQVISLCIRKYYGETNKTIIKFKMKLEPVEFKGRASKEETELCKTLSI